MNTKFRTDIEGLRALAVLAVVLEHASSRCLPGGFIGVDIFFVISGYLITQISLNEHQNNTFSILKFYTKRIRRILPALFFFIVSWLAIGYYALPPWQYDLLGKTGVSTLLFFSNISLLAQTQDYFSVTAGFHPLLHTWSLAVEEQFYILFPWLLLPFLWLKSQRWLAIFVVVIVLVSLYQAVTTLPEKPGDVFFLMPYRAWEIGMGVLMALLPKYTLKAQWSNACSISAFLVLFACMMFYTKTTPFPGLAAMPVVFATAALLYLGATNTGFAQKILSIGPVRWFGKISFSLYLWHWPSLVVVKTYFVDTNSAFTAYGSIALALVFSVGMSWLSWKLIENPLRKTGTEKSIKAIVFYPGVMATALVLLAGCFYVASTQGIKNRITQEDYKIFQAATTHVSNIKKCAPNPKNENITCNIHSGPGPKVLLWGDSHAAAFLNSYEHWAKENDLNADIVYMNACPPLLELGRFTGTKENTCRTLNNAVINKLQNTDYDKVILVARWPLYYTGTRSKNEPGPKIDIKGTNQFEGETETSLIEKSIKHTLKTLSRMEQDVYVFGSVAEIPWNVPQSHLNRTFFGRPKITTIPSAIPLQRSSHVDSVLEQTSKQEGAVFIPISPLLCGDENTCDISANGQLLYRDGDHLSSYGAMSLYDKTFGSIKISK